MIFALAVVHTLATTMLKRLFSVVISIVGGVIFIVVGIALSDTWERFYNRQRRHGYVGNISPTEFEERTSWA